MWKRAFADTRLLHGVGLKVVLAASTAISVVVALGTFQLEAEVQPAVVSFVATWLAGAICATLEFFFRLHRARADILVDHLIGLSRDNQRLASMVEQFEHRRKKTHDQLTALADRGRGPDRRSNDGTQPDFWETWTRDFAAWEKAVDELAETLTWTHADRIRGRGARDKNPREVLVVRLEALGF